MSLRGGLLVPPVSLVVVPPISLVVQPKTILRPRRTRLGGLLERSDCHGDATRRADSWRASISSSGHTHEAEALAAASEDTIGNGFTIGKRTIAAWALERVLVRGYDTLEGTVGWTSGGGEGVCCCCCCCCCSRLMGCAGTATVLVPVLAAHDKAILNNNNYRLDLLNRSPGRSTYSMYKGRHQNPKRHPSIDISDLRILIPRTHIIALLEKKTLKK